MIVKYVLSFWGMILKPCATLGATTTTTVARGFIVVVVIVIIVTAVTTVPPPLSCDLFVCCVFVCHCVLSPSSSNDGLPAHRISHRHCRRFHCRHHRPRHRLLHLRRHLTPPLCNLFDCCLRVLVSCF